MAFMHVSSNTPYGHVVASWQACRYGMTNSRLGVLGVLGEEDRPAYISVLVGRGWALKAEGCRRLGILTKH